MNRLSRIALIVRMLVALAITTGVVRLGCADEPPTEVEKARSAYEKAREKCQADLLKGFDDAADRITKLKLGAEERAKRVEALSAEKERFEKKGLIPWSESMRRHLLGYQKNLARAEAPLKKLFDQEIGVALKAKDTGEVNRLRAELATILDVKVVATWSHGNEVDGSRDELKFYSNGRVGAPDGDHTWSFQNGMLTMKWPNPLAPGGAWVDDCTVSADGRTYSGKNQKGIRVGGSYVAPKGAKD